MSTCLYIEHNGNVYIHVHVGSGLISDNLSRFVGLCRGVRVVTQVHIYTCSTHVTMYMCISFLYLVDCSAVLCFLPQCDDNATAVVPPGQCCPICTGTF